MYTITEAIVKLSLVVPRQVTTINYLSRFRLLILGYSRKSSCELK